MSASCRIAGFEISISICSAAGYLPRELFVTTVLGYLHRPTNARSAFAPTDVVVFAAPSCCSRRPVARRKQPAPPITVAPLLTVSVTVLPATVPRVKLR